MPSWGSWGLSYADEEERRRLEAEAAARAAAEQRLPLIRVPVEQPVYGPMQGPQLPREQAIAPAPQPQPLRANWNPEWGAARLALPEPNAPLPPPVAAPHRIGTVLPAPNPYASAPVEEEPDAPQRAHDPRTLRDYPYANQALLSGRQPSAFAPNALREQVFATQGGLGRAALGVVERMGQAARDVDEQYQRGELGGADPQSYWENDPANAYARERAAQRWREYDALEPWMQRYGQNVADNPAWMGFVPGLGAAWSAAETTAQGLHPSIANAFEKWVYAPLKSMYTTPLDRREEVARTGDPAAQGSAPALADYYASVGGALNQTYNPFNPNLVLPEGAPNNLMTRAVRVGLNLLGASPNIPLAAVGATDPVALAQERFQAAQRTREEIKDSEHPYAVLAMLNATSGADSMRNTLDTIVNKETRVQELRDAASRFEAEGRYVDAAEAWRKAEELAGMSNADIVDSNVNLWAELLEGVILDPTNLATAVLSGGLSLTAEAASLRKFSKLYDIADVAALRNIDELGKGTGAALDAVKTGGAAAVGASKGRTLNPLALLERTDETKAAFDANWLYNLSTALFRDVRDRTTARALIDQLAKDPKALVRGILLPGHPAADEGGIVRFGPGLVGNKEVAQRLPYFKALRDDLLKMKSLDGTDAFSHDEFYAELDDILWKGTRRRYQVEGFELPHGAVDVRLTRNPDGTASLQFLGKKPAATKKGQPPTPVLGSRQYASMAEARQAKDALERQAKASGIGLGTRAANAVAGTQRAILNDMFLGLRVKNWWNNALSATGMLLANDSYTLRPTADIRAHLASVFNSVSPTMRVGGSDVAEFGQGAIMRGSAIGETLGRVPGPIGRAVTGTMKKVYDIPYGKTGINLFDLAEVPIGEENFYLRAFSVPFFRQLRAGVDDLVKREFGPQARNIIQDPQLYEALTDEISDAIARGDRGTLGRALREWTRNNTARISIKRVGVPDELLTHGTHKALDEILSDPTLTEQEAARRIRQAFAEERRQHAQTLLDAPPQPSPEWSSHQSAREASLVVDQIKEAAKRAGKDVDEAERQGAQIAEGVARAHDAGYDALRRDIVNTPADARSWDATYDFWFDVQELKMHGRQALSLARTEAARANTPAAWEEYERSIREFWGEIYPREFGKLIEQARTGIGDRQYRARHSWSEMLEKWLWADDSEISSARAIDMADPNNRGGQVDWERVIAANQAMLDKAQARAMETFRRFPTQENWDLLIHMQRQAETEGARIATYIGGLREQARAKAITWDEYRARAHGAWHQYWSDAQVYTEAMRKHMVWWGLVEEAKGGISWTDEFLGQEFTLLYPIGDNMWAARGADGQIRRFADPRRVKPHDISTPPIVPQEQIDAYRNALRTIAGPNGEKRIDEVLAQIDQRIPNEIPAPYRAQAAPAAQDVTQAAPATPPNLARVDDLIATPAPAAEPTPRVGQAQMFAETSEDLPIFSGGTYGSTETGKFAPTETARQEGLLDMRPRMGAAEPSYAPKVEPSPSAVAPTESAAAQPMRAPTPSAASAPTAAEIGELAAQAGITLQDKSGKPFLMHLRRFAKKNAGVSIGKLENMTEAERTRLGAALNNRIAERTGRYALDPTQDEIAALEEQLRVMEATWEAYASPHIRRKSAKPTGEVPGTGRKLYDIRDTNRPPEAKTLTNRAGGRKVSTGDVKGNASEGTGSFRTLYLQYLRRGRALGGEERGTHFIFEDLIGANDHFPDETAIRKFFDDYDRARGRIRKLQGNVEDASRYAKMSAAEIAEKEGKRLVEAGFSQADIDAAAETGNRRFLLDGIEIIEGRNEDLDLGESYFYGGLIPIDPAWFGLGRNRTPTPSEIRFFDADGRINARAMFQRARAMFARSRATGGEKATEAGDVAQHMVTKLDEAERAVIDNLALLRRGVPNRLTAGQRLALVDLADKIGPRMDDVVARALAVGEDMANWMMLNYRDRRNIDTVLSVLYPYHYWWSRMPGRLAAASLQKPSLVNLYYKYQRMKKEENRRAGVTGTRNEGTLPVPGSSEWRFGDPFENVLPYQQFIYPNPFVDPDEENNTLGRFKNTIQQWTPQFYPAMEFGMALYMDATNPLPNGEKRTDRFNLGSIAPGYRSAGYARSAATGEMPMGSGLLESGDQYDPYRAWRAAAWIGYEKKIDPMVVQFAQGMIYNEMRGLERNQGVPAEYVKQAEALRKESVQRMAAESLGRTAGPVLTGVSVYPAPQSEVELRNMRRYYGALGYDPFAHPEGSKARRTALIEDEKAGKHTPTTWGSGAVLPGGEGRSPIESASRTLRDREYADVDARRQAEIDQLILKYEERGETAPEDEVYAVIDKYQPERDAIRARYEWLPSIMQSSRGMNPREEAERILNEILGSELPGKPQRPENIDGLTAAEKKGYYDALAKWRQRQDATLQSRLEMLANLMPEESGVRPEVQLEVQRLLQGQYASDLERRFRNRFMSDVQYRWAEQVAFDKEVTAAEWEKRRNHVRASLGEDGALKFREYMDADEATREQLRKSDWQYSAANLAAFNPDEYRYAVTAWGPQWYKIYHDAPDHPGDGASEAQMRAYYDALNAYQLQNPQHEAIRLWLNGRPNAGKRGGERLQADGTTIYERDFGEDMAELLAMYPGVFESLNISNQAWDRYNKSGKQQAQAPWNTVPNWDQIDRDVTAYREWRSEFADAPRVLAALPEPPKPKVADYVGERPVGSGAQPILPAGPEMRPPGFVREPGQWPEFLPNAPTAAAKGETVGGPLADATAKLGASGAKTQATAGDLKRWDEYAERDEKFRERLAAGQAAGQRKAELEARRAQARELFGDDIWAIVDGYDKNWSKAQKAAYLEQYPQLRAFWDWWYGNETQEGGQRAQGGSAAARSFSGGGFVGGGFGGGGDFSIEPGEYRMDVRIDPRGFPAWMMPPESELRAWRPWQEVDVPQWLRAGDRLAYRQWDSWRPPDVNQSVR